MRDNVLSTISSKMESFSKSQKLIGEYILNHYDKAAYMTALKLATSVNVSESTVVRFALELGFDGYPELQKSLQEIIKNRLTTLQRIDIANERIGTSDILNKVLTQDVDRIKHTLDCVSNENFNTAIEKIISARRIFILGAMSSSILAKFLDYYFQLIFDNVTYVQGVNVSGIFQQIVRINENDTFISMSFPRYSTSTLRATKYAHEQGANIIAITDSENSPLAKYAHQLLVARSDLTSFVDSLVAPLSVINALIIGVGLRNKENLSEIFEKLDALWDENGVYEKDI